jgi:hypothetical protein
LFRTTKAAAVAVAVQVQIPRRDVPVALRAPRVAAVEGEAPVRRIDGTGMRHSS